MKATAPGFWEVSPVNIRLLGDDDTGKSTFLTLLDLKGSGPYDGSTEPDVSREIELVDGLSSSVTVNIWDTPKWLRWDDTEQTVYPKELDALIVFFDVTNRSSFLNIKTKWMKWIDRTREGGEEEDEIDILRNEVVFILLGNKCDSVKTRTVETEEVTKDDYLTNYFFDYIETSALDGKEAAMLLIKKMVAEVVKRRQTLPPRRVLLRESRDFPGFDEGCVSWFAQNCQVL